MISEYFNAAAVMTGATRRAFLMRGILVVLIGILLLFQGFHLLTFLTKAIGVIFLIGGIWTLVTLGMTPKARRIFWSVYGIGMLLFGVLLTAYPVTAEKVLAYFISIWFLVGGVMSIWDTAQSRTAFSGKVIPLVSGLISLFIGFMLFTWPLTGLSAMLWIAGLILIVEGAMLISFSMLLKRFDEAAQKDEAIDAEIIPDNRRDLPPEP